MRKSTCGRNWKCIVNVCFISPFVGYAANQATGESRRRPTYSTAAADNIHIHPIEAEPTFRAELIPPPSWMNADIHTGETNTLYLGRMWNEHPVRWANMIVSRA